MSTTSYTRAPRALALLKRERQIHLDNYWLGLEMNDHDVKRWALTEYNSVQREIDNLRGKR